MRYLVLIVLFILLSIPIIAIGYGAASPAIPVAGCMESGLGMKTSSPYILVGKNIPILYLYDHDERVSMTWMRVENYVAGTCICDPLKVLSNPRRIEGYVDGVYYRGIKGDNGLLILGEQGYFYFRLGDGESYPFKPFGNDKYLYSLIGSVGRYEDVNCRLGYNLTYAGLSGEETAKIITGVKIFPNGTTVTVTGTRTIRRNPYEKYYITIGGYRLEPPLIIRGSDPSKTPHHIRAQLIKGLIPIVRHCTLIRITKSIVDEIVEQYRLEARAPPETIRLLDIYLSISRDLNNILPTIVIGSNESTPIIWYQITPSGKVVKQSEITVAGTPDPGDLEPGIIDGDAIASKLAAGSNPISALLPEGYYGVILLGGVVTAVALLFVIRKFRASAKHS